MRSSARMLCRRSRAASIALRSNGIAPASNASSICTCNARRSSSADGAASSSIPSSSRIRPIRQSTRSVKPSRSMATQPPSSAAPNLAAKDADMRSADGTRITPPSHSASTPRASTGRPARNVAARSRPPSSRSSSIDGGIFRTGMSGRNVARNAEIKRSRPSLAGERTTRPPSEAGSTASMHAASAASSYAAAVSALMLRTCRP